VRACLRECESFALEFACLGVIFSGDIVNM
jgi:hypothetical protein